MKNPKLKKEFVNLIEQNQGIIFKVSRMYCDNEEDRKDLFQDILIQLWNAYSAFKGDSKFSTWMYRVALNTAISRFRVSKKKEKEVSVSEFNVNITVGETYSDKEERYKMLHKAISKLSKADKAIIILYMDDYPYDEIAEIAGITMTNAGVKIGRIKRKLQEILKEMDYGY